MQTRFRDRFEAGRFLARLLAEYRGMAGVLVLALPRGGVPVGFEIALALQAPLDVFLVRKLGVPGHAELAMGAIASGGVRVLNAEVIQQLRITDEEIARVVAHETVELQRRAAAYRDSRPVPEIGGATVILVDDGLATGSTMLAALRAIRALQPAAIIVAVPVATPMTLVDISRAADDVICPLTPEPLYSVGTWYDDFSETLDDDVLNLLRQAAAAQHL